MKHFASSILVFGLFFGVAAQAEAPDSALRPEPRAVPDSPAGPEARSASAPTPLILELHPDGEPTALTRVAMLDRPASVPVLTTPARNFIPPVPRQPPLLSNEPPEKPLEGPRGAVMAEELMTEPPPVPVILGGWAGSTPPTRPGIEPPLAETPAAGRPRARPLAPQDPQPILPPEPDAPPAYAPAQTPDILPVGPEYSIYAVARAIMPTVRPASVVQRAEQARAALVRGQVCGNPGIQGEVIAAIHGGGGCGVEEPVLIRSIDGIALSEPATMDCTTAEALLDWTRHGARPAVGTRGGGLARIETMGSYTCRPRNNQAGARMSEHGRGRAIDIGAVVLADGSRISVLHDWPDPALSAMRKAACGMFSTVIGPGQRFHDDHLHLDTARGRGPYCR